MAVPKVWLRRWGMRALRPAWSAVCGGLFGMVLVTVGCVCRSGDGAATRRFEFFRDTVAFTNETRWVYAFDGEGKTRAHRREPRPAYSHRCFTVALLNRQFWDHAAFDPGAAPLEPSALRQRIREVLSRSARCPSAPEDRVVFGGVEGLRALSEEHCALLMSLSAGPVTGYLQRGHWRMVLPFGRRHQRREAERLRATIQAGRPAVVHVVTFPRLSINHAVLVFDVREAGPGWEFLAADPNDPGTPIPLTYHLEEGWFSLPRTSYFVGGRVNAYEVYRNAWY